MQLLSVPVKNVPDIAYVFGMLRLYKSIKVAGRKTSATTAAITVPVQGNETRDR